MNVIELSHLTKRYGAHRGVEDLTLSVREGEIYGFIGPNGAIRQLPGTLLVAARVKARGVVRQFTHPHVLKQLTSPGR